MFMIGFVTIVKEVLADKILVITLQPNILLMFRTSF